MHDPYAEFEKFELDNGLTVYASHLPGRLWQKIAFVIHSGSKEDPLNLSGVAHFLEHMISENTKLGSEKITSFFKNSGGSVNLGSTNYFATTYGFSLPINKFNQGLKIIGEMLLQSQITHNIEKERSIIINEFYRKYPKTIDYDIAVNTNTNLYCNHWLKNIVSNLGNINTISTIGNTDMQNYYDTHYNPHNISIVSSGGLNIDAIKQRLQRSPFSTVKPGYRNPVIPKSTTIPLPLSNHLDIKLSDHIDFRGQLKQGSCEVIALLPGLLSNELAIIIKCMLNKMLWDELRIKRSWSYSQETDYTDLMDNKEMSIFCGSVDLNNMSKTKNILSNTLAKICNNRTLFNTTKKQLIASLIIDDYPTSQVIDNIVYRITAGEPIISTTELIQKYQSQSFEDLQALASYFTSEKQWHKIIYP